MARIDCHVVARCHVAIDAGATGSLVSVMVMRCKIIDSRIMAAGAESVSFEKECPSMWIVAIGTSDSLGVHTTLKKRTVYVDFIEDLAIVVIEPGFQQTQKVSL